MLICHLVPHLSLWITSLSIDRRAWRILASHKLAGPDKCVVWCVVFLFFSRSFGIMNSASTLSFFCSHLPNNTYKNVLKCLKNRLLLQNTLKTKVQRKWLQFWCVSLAVQPQIQYSTLLWYLYLGHCFELGNTFISVCFSPCLHTLAHTPCEHAVHCTNVKHAYTFTCIGSMPRGTKLPWKLPWTISSWTNQ